MEKNRFPLFTSDLSAIYSWLSLSKSFESSLCAFFLSSPIKNLIFAPVQTGRLHNDVTHVSDVSVIQSNWIKLFVWWSRLICHVRIADLCLCHCKCFCDILCLLCCCWLHTALLRPEYQDHNFDISLTPAKGFLFAPTHKTRKGKLYYLDKQAAAISAHMLSYTVSYKKDVCYIIWVMSKVEHLHTALHQPLCT